MTNELPHGARFIRELPADVSGIPDEKLAKIKAEVKNVVRAERERAVLESYKRQLLREERAKFDPSHELVEVEIKLPLFAPYIMIEGTIYHDGDVVEVTLATAQFLRELMYNANLHDRASKNPREHNYPATRRSVISPYSGGVVRA